MEYLIITIQLILSLSILVVLHEFGHFLPARLFGMRVDKFYLFFNPWFSLYKVQKGETEYGIGWLPLGGYVKIAGMVDESMDTEMLNQPPQPWEFRSKPAWQRLIVMLGGVIVNFLLGFFIWAMLLWGYGKEYIPAQNAIYGVVTDEVAREMGLRDGDIINKIGEKPFDKFDSRILQKEIVVGDAKTITVTRDGQAQVLNLPEGIVSKLVRYEGALVAPRLPFVIADVASGKPAEKAGFLKGDSLIALNGVTYQYYHEFSKEIKNHKNESINITLVRNGETKDIAVTTTAEGFIGVAPKSLPTETQTFGFAESFPAGVNEGIGFLGAQLKAFGKMFSGEIKASESLGGFGSIAKLFPTSWDWYRFWYITAILSLILGFMNLLPVPALDGGHAIFLIIEMIIRRPVPQKILEYSQLVGILLLFGLMLYANGMDIYRAIAG